MLDFDLAELYEVETKLLNQVIKRNISRFRPMLLQTRRHDVSQCIESAGKNWISKIVSNPQY
jgi:hypothetical protein